MLTLSAITPVQPGGDTMGYSFNLSVADGAKFARAGEVPYSGDNENQPPRKRLETAANSQAQDKHCLLEHGDKIAASLGGPRRDHFAGMDMEEIFTLTLRLT